MNPEEREKLIREIEEMRKERCAIKQKMQILSDHRDAITENPIDANDSSKNYASSVRRESASEQMAKVEMFKNLQMVETKKQTIVQEINKEVDDYQRKQMPQFLQMQTNAHKTRTDVLNKYKELSSALLEMRPNDELNNRFRLLITSCTKKSAFIVNKQREIAQNIDEKFKLMAKRFELHENYYRQKFSNTEGIKLQIARRRTSDLPSF